jgi:hypothetical protein
MGDATSKTSKTEGTSNPPTRKKSTRTRKGTAGKMSKPKKEKTPKEPMVVFAFRLSKAQRDLIHKAAGPAKGTKFVRAAAIAAANLDRPAFDQLLAQAKSNLK